mmetsp:Transcript_51107/g.91789  ORF Transcript_51107/g.91789 Transcript_51107/m.91789 type:complete len:303 (+) Transcript_51107:102-1010(+)
MRPKSSSLFFYCCITLASTYAPRQLVRRAASLQDANSSANDSTPFFASKRTQDSDTNADVMANMSSSGEGKKNEEQAPAETIAVGYLEEALPTDVFEASIMPMASEIPAVTQHIQEAAAHPGSAHGKKETKASGGMPWKTIVVAVLVIGALVYFAPVIKEALFEKKTPPGRLAEVSVNAADQKVWASSKAKQAYRKSVLAAQSAKSSSGSEDGSPANASPTLKVPEQPQQRPRAAASARRSAATASTAVPSDSEAKAKEEAAPARPRSPSQNSANTVGTGGSGGYKSRRRGAPAAAAPAPES